MTEQEASSLLGFAVPDGWKFIEIHRGGTLAAFVLVKGAEIHVSRLPEFKGRWLTRQDVERICLPIIKQFGHVKTAVMASNSAGQAFVQRLGFNRQHESNGIVHYRTEKVKHARL
jgi:hypothetical protein